MPENHNPTYISVDVETAGPNPSQYSLLSVGACTVFEPQETFYVELQPFNDNYLPESVLVGRLNWNRLKERRPTSRSDVPFL